LLKVDNKSAIALIKNPVLHGGKVSSSPGVRRKWSDQGVHQERRTTG
jgi:hypothetical protein